MDQNEALVVNNFNITNRGIVADIQHLKQGFSAGTELYSKESGKIWQVENKLLFGHRELEQ